MKTISLKNPIKYGSETISQLTLRAPKAKDMRGMPLQMGMDEMLALASRCTAQPPSVIDELELEDLTNIMEELGGFLPGGRQTGRKP